jgi:Cu(I)/Ag(I) efflux system membrane fusion protein
MTRWVNIVALGLAIAGCQREGTEDQEHAAHTNAPRSLPDAPAGHGGSEHAEHGAMPEGYAEVTLTSERQQLIGLRTAPAEKSVLAAPIRATGILAVEQDKEAHVHSRLDGWIQKLYVERVGEVVKRGQPLYAIYSQEAYAAQLEYLRAKKFSPELAQAARERLSQWGIPSDQVGKIDKAGASQKLVIRAPIGGTVLERGLLEGHYVEPGQMLYHIADLSELWVLAEVYEYEVDRIDPKGTANVLIEGSTRPSELAVDYIYPTVDPVTRTVRVRLLLPNPEGRYRPQAFATVELPARAESVLSVPDEAVIDTGVRQVVYRALGDGRFAPVSVHIGRRVQGRAEILHGLDEGDTVVVSAQFLLDSESRLRGQTASGDGSEHAGHAGHG